MKYLNLYKFLLICFLSILFCSEILGQDIFRVKSISPLYPDPIILKLGPTSLISDTIYNDSTDLEINFENQDKVLINKIGINWFSDTINLIHRKENILNDFEDQITGISQMNGTLTLIRMYKRVNFEIHKIDIIYSLDENFKYGFSFNVEKLKKQF